MGHVVDFSKLAELRARTDRDLIRIVSAELDRAIVVAHLAGGTQSVFHVRATSAYTRAKALLEKMQSPKPESTAEVEAKMKELRLALDLVPSALDHNDHQEQPACC
jgi:hypothetical protein